MLKPQHNRSRVNKSPSRAIRACLAVPNFSTFETICNEAYLASRRFCLVSGFSPSVRKTNDYCLFLLALQRTNQTNLCKMVVEEYFEMVPHATNRILLLATMLVQSTNRRQCCYRIHGTIERIQFLHLDIAQCQPNAPDNNSIHPVIHNRIVAICTTENVFE